jgi:hypothetical protein
MVMPPKVDSIMLCDDVVREGDRTSILGVWDRITAGGFPADCSGGYVYVRLTELCGRYRFEIRLIPADPAGAAEPWASPIAITASDPRARFDLVFELEALRLLEAGRYGVQVVYNGSVAAEVTFDVVGPEPS